MFIVISCMISGIVVGYFFHNRKIRFIHNLIMIFIWLLLFVLGFEVGANEFVIREFGKLGFEAFVLAFAGTMGSIIFSGLLWLAVRTKSMSK